MKLLSIAIPCYNSAAYMRRCIDSLLPGGEDVEILIVNDGSQIIRRILQRNTENGSQAWSKSSTKKMAVMALP